MTRRATRVDVIGRPFGDRRRRSDNRRRFDGANRLRRGAREAAALNPRLGGLSPAWRASAAWPPPAAPRASPPRSGSAECARSDAPAAAAVSATGRGGGSGSRAAPFGCGLCSSSAQEGAGSPGGRRCRRTSTTNERDGRFIARGPLRALRDCRGAPDANRGRAPGRGPMLKPAQTKIASRVKAGNASANRNLTLSGSFAND